MSLHAYSADGCIQKAVTMKQHMDFCREGVKPAAHCHFRAQGTLYSQKHAVCFNGSTNPFCLLLGCHQLDSALHTLSGCQNHIISNMKAERHNVAGRMIIEACSKSPWGAGLVDTNNRK
eukprot:1146111-Pelagomonas_calceolata.AAC.1